MRPLVLCYHAVSPDWDYPLAVTEEALRAQLRWVSRLGYRWGRPSDLLGGGRVAHVTFDDAYASVLDAVPLLRARGATATVFVPTGFVGGTFRTEILDDAAPAHRAVLTWDDLRGLAREGVAIGSHTVTHAHLTELDHAELRAELLDSRRALEDELGTRCTSLAYPFGEYDDRVRGVALECGYEHCFALRNGDGLRTALQRILVFRTHVGLRFAVRVSGAGRSTASVRVREWLR